MKFPKLYACTSKKVYERYKEAERAVRTTRKYNKNDEKDLHVYTCNFCHKFHIGHKPIVRRKKHV